MADCKLVVRIDREDPIGQKDEGSGGNSIRPLDGRDVLLDAPAANFEN
jgi:hypothetical protein